MHRLLMIATSVIAVSAVFAVPAGVSQSGTATGTDTDTIWSTARG
jgi:hypothetical protein